jgi:predicted ArsR family transcriptional regulator
MDDLDRQIAGVAALAEPQRRALYDLVVQRGDAVTKDEAAHELSIARTVAGFHLDRLVADGLLAAEFRRVSGRTGPGAGRPAKLYRRAAADVSVSLPPRRYELAAQLLARAVAVSIEGALPVEAALARVAADHGRTLGDAARERAPAGDRAALTDAALAVLEEQGYEPRTGDGEVVLANCPFHALAEEQRALVCAMNDDLLGAMTAALGDDVLTARLEPAEGRCCVRLTGGAVR